MMEHQDAVSEVGFVPYFDDIAVDYDPNSTVDVQMHDGSHLRLRKLHEDYDPTDRVNAIKMLTEVHEKGEVLTGVFYVNTQKPDFSTLLNLVDEPLATLAETRTRPGREVLAKLMEAHL
jgi:2-oxoglutarate ferredoxin oxidoreductase subunit beta